jgi:hypothetical protein
MEYCRIDVRIYTVIGPGTKKCLLLKVYAVGASGRVLLHLKVVQAQPKLAQDGVPEPLQLFCGAKKSVNQSWGRQKKF